MRRICVFCGSNMGRSPLYREGAIALSDSLVKLGIELIYGGWKGRADGSRCR